MNRTTSCKTIAYWRSTALKRELGLEVKAEPIICPTRHGFEFLGCRVYPSHLKFNDLSLFPASPLGSAAGGSRITHLGGVAQLVRAAES